MHKKWQVLINVYVDDFKVAGKGPLNHVWKVLRDAGLDIDDAVKYQTYLGCAQREIPIDKAIMQNQVATYKTTFTHSHAKEAPVETAAVSYEIVKISTDTADVDPENAHHVPLWDKSFDEL